MTSLAITLCSLLTTLFLVAGGVKFVSGVLRAPEGYEDEAGFHYVGTEAARAGAFPVDLDRRSTHI